jgi:hypothetical protein
MKLHYTATKTFHHPMAGDLELTGEALHLPGDPDLTVITYTLNPQAPPNRHSHPRQLEHSRGIRQRSARSPPAPGERQRGG